MTTARYSQPCQMCWTRMLLEAYGSRLGHEPVMDAINDAINTSGI
ncbi:hypothetical protein [Dickeya dianthicola]|nr:hypothetical protein [Dickeya dianthicola]